MLKRRIFSFGTMVSPLPFQVLSLAMLINFCLCTAATARNVSFTPHEIDTNFNGAHSVCAADLDQDGDLDVVGAAHYGDRVSWWESALNAQNMVPTYLLLLL